MHSAQDHKTRTLCLAGALHAFTHIYQVALMPLYLLIQRDFKFASVSQATSLVTVLMIAYFLPSYPMGVLADRVNRKGLLGVGLLINSVGFIALSFAPNYGWAITATIIAGAGGSFFHPAATAMVARLYPVGTGKALGLLGIGASVGFFFGPLYTGWRAGSLEPLLGAAAWRRPVLELGILGILMSGVFAWLAQSEEPVPNEARPDARKERMFPTAALAGLFLFAGIAFGIRDFAGMSMGSLGSLFLQKAHGFDPKLTGLALSGIFIASAVSNPVFGSFSDRGRIRWTAFVLSVAAGLIGIFPHVPPGWTIPTYLVYGFFFLSNYPMVEAALMESVPDAVRGRVFGLFITVGGLLGNLSHWLVGVAVKRLGDAANSPSSYFGIYAGLAGLMILSLVGLPCLHAIRKREHLEPSLASTDSTIRNPRSAIQ
jgi:MFS family permease